MRDAKDPMARMLLTDLPKLLKGHGRTFEGYGKNYRAAVIVVCDLDDRKAVDFLNELNGVLDQCHPRPETRFCLAVEEGEAWLLGDLDAVKAAYPHGNDSVLQSYVNDSICGTWEKLADAVYQGGARALAKRGWQAVGAEKSAWAMAISPEMDVDTNASRSFRRFRDQVRSLCAGSRER